MAACTVDPDDSVSEEDVAAWLQAGAAEAAEAAESGEPALKVPRDLEAIGRLVRGEGKKKPSMLELIFSPAAGQPEPGPKETGFGSLFARRKRATEGAGEEGSLTSRGITGAFGRGAQPAGNRVCSGCDGADADFSTVRACGVTRGCATRSDPRRFDCLVHGSSLLHTAACPDADVTRSRI